MLKHRPIPTCLNCRFFRPVDDKNGLCRVDKGTIDQSSYPSKAHEDSCQRWDDCGQQYHIRIGWLNSRKNREEG